MTDRELLELSAKAAGLDVEWCGPFDCMLRLDMPKGPDGGRESWNPLTDDGDALRLAVKLRLVVDAFEGEVVGAQSVEKFDPSDLAATRRAIVRAAAAIGATAQGGGR